MKFIGLFVLIAVQIFTAQSANLSPRRFFFEDVSAPQSVRIGSEVKIYCKVTDGGSITENRDWKYCTWTRESDRSQCKTTYVCKGELCFIGVGEYSIETRCDSQLMNTEFFGDNPEHANTLCGLRIPRVSMNDDGPWTCRVTQCAVRGCDAASHKTIEATVAIKTY